MLRNDDTKIWTKNIISNYSTAYTFCKYRLTVSYIEMQVGFKNVQLYTILLQHESYIKFK